MGTELVPYDDGFAHQQGRQRAKKVEVARRVTQCVMWLMQGAGERDIFQLAEQEKWGVTNSQVQKYLMKARKWLKRNLEEEREQLQVLHENKRRRLYDVALRLVERDGIKAVYAALEILRDEAKLQGLYDGRRFAGQESEEDDQAGRELLARLRAFAGRMRSGDPPAGEPAGPGSGPVPDPSRNGTH